MSEVHASRLVRFRVDDRIEKAVDALIGLYADEIGEPLSHHAFRRVLDVSRTFYLQAVEMSRLGYDTELFHDPDEPPLPYARPVFPAADYFAPSGDWRGIAWAAKLPSADGPKARIEEVRLSPEEDLAILPVTEYLGMPSEQVFFEQALGYAYTLARGFVHGFRHVAAVKVDPASRRKTEIRPMALEHHFRLWAGVPLAPSRSDPPPVPVIPFRA